MSYFCDHAYKHTCKDNGYLPLPMARRTPSTHLFHDPFVDGPSIPTAFMIHLKTHSRSQAPTSVPARTSQAFVLLPNVPTVLLLLLLLLLLLSLIQTNATLLQLHLPFGYQSCGPVNHSMANTSRFLSFIPVLRVRIR